MIWRTHIVSSEAVALPLFYLATPTIEVFAQYLPIAASSVAFGAILPDIDDPKSRAGRKLLPIAVLVSLVFRHRTATHSLVIWGALFLLSLAFWFSPVFSSEWGLFFLPSVPTTALLIAMGVFVGCFLHILGDLMTTAPVRGALFPISDKIFWILPRFARFTVGSPLESVYFVMFAVALGGFGIWVFGDWIALFKASL